MIIYLEPIPPLTKPPLSSFTCLSYSLISLPQRRLERVCESVDCYKVVEVSKVVGSGRDSEERGYFNFDISFFLRGVNCER